MNVHGYAIDDENIRVVVIDGKPTEIINKKGLEQLVRQHGTPKGFEILKNLQERFPDA